MEVGISQFVEEMKTPLKKLSFSKLREREEIWRALWSWIDDDTKKIIYKIGSTVRIFRADWRCSFGELGEVKLEPSEYNVYVYEKRYNETDGKYYYERKVTQIPANRVIMIEFLSESESAEDVEQFVVESLPEEEEVVA